MAALAAVQPAWAGVSVSLNRIHHSAFSAEGIRVELASEPRRPALIHIARLNLAGIEYRDLAVECGDLELDSLHIQCSKGKIRRSDMRGGDRPALPFEFSYRFRDDALSLVIPDTEIVSWSPVVKRLRAWRPTGHIELRLNADPSHIHIELMGQKIGFGNRVGTIAGEGIVARLVADAERTGGEWRWTADLDWPDGEIYAAPWYRRAGVEGQAAGRLSREMLSVDRVRLDWRGVGSITGGLTWDRHTGQLAEWGFVTDRLDLAAVVAEWVHPWLDQKAIPKIGATGKVRFSISGRGDAIGAYYVGLEDASLVDGTGSVHLNGVDARFPWEEGGSSEADLSVAGGKIADFELGSFRIPIKISGNRATLEQLSLPMLDGCLHIGTFAVSRAPDGWHGQFSGSIEGLSMPKISAALKLPPMAGSFSARIPDARYAGNLLNLDGGFSIEVFDGRIEASHLSIVDPLQPTQRFEARVTASHLDLGMMTRTFSLGSIEGRIDAEILGLELQGWRPLRFDARIFSSPGDYRRTISRGALQDISALGGTAGAMAVGASPARWFNSFDYQSLGLSASLRGRRLHLDGIEPAASPNGNAATGRGFVLIKGGGLPRVNVIGYNPEVDWNLLLSRIRAVIAGKSKVVIE